MMSDVLGPFFAGTKFENVFRFASIKEVLLKLSQPSGLSRSHILVHYLTWQLLQEVFWGDWRPWVGALCYSPFGCCALRLRLSP
jgi:hypothetical protein